MTPPLYQTIAFKLFLPIAVFVLLSISYIYFVWIPDYVDITLNALTAQIEKTILSVSEGLIPLMLEDKLSAVYATLEIVQQDNPRWVDLQLHDAEGRSIYPLLPTDLSEGSATARVITQDIETSGLNLGTISVTYDFSTLLAEVESQSYDLISIVALLMVLFACIVGMLVQFLIVKPVSDLRAASDAMAKGDYRAKLPLAKPDELGQLVQSFQVMRDEIREGQDELLTASRRARAASETKSTFLANMSHEIRTPMNGIVGLTDVLIEEAETPDLRDNLQIISQSSRRLLSLLNEILDISKIEAGTLPLNTEDTDVARICSEQVALFQAAAAAKDVSLTASLGDVPELVQLDPLRLQQVLSNLISNAIKFTDVGSVCVGLSEQVHNRQSAMRITVTDTGIGISDEDRHKVFQEFRQVDGAKSGAGLGLAICKKVVDLMGGTITLTSEPGKGTEFAVTLPYEVATQRTATDDIAASEQAGAIGDFDASALRVLLVDDDQINRTFGETLLSHLGVPDVDVLETGEAALDRLTTDQFDIIFLDCQMPGLDGFETARRIRLQEAASNLPRTPIVALTAQALPGDRQRCLDAGMDDYVTKPIRRAEMLATLAKFAVSSKADAS